MDQNVFRSPSPYSEFNLPRQTTPHFMTSEGMLMPSHMQPPPMYGPRGPTIPPKYLQKQQGKKKYQRNETDFFCETCDYDFTSQPDYQKHISEHRTCSIDGCTFFAHSDIIKNHITQQHNSGLYEKLKNVNTPEEITKWREERKKRYPTQANVKLRQQVHAERSKRGERLNDKKPRFGQRHDREKCRQNETNDTNNKNTKRKRIRRRRNRDSPNNSMNAQKECAPKEEENEDNVSDGDGVKKFKGTSNLPDYPRPKMVNKKSKAKNALASLAGLYGSDSDGSDCLSSDNENNAVSAQKAKSPSPEISSSHFNISSDEDDHFENQPEMVDMLSSMIAESNSCSISLDKSNAIELENSPVNKSQMKNNKDYNPNEIATSLSSVNENISTTPNTLILSIEPENEEDKQVEVPFEKVVETFPEEENQPINDQTANENDSTEKKGRRRNRRGRKSNDDTKNNIASASRNRKKKIISGLDYSKLRRRPQNTMLEKLLHTDIVHERNVLLQCVRYVVEKNFFGIGQPKE